MVKDGDPYHSDNEVTVKRQECSTQVNLEKKKRILENRSVMSS